MVFVARNRPVPQDSEESGMDEFSPDNTGQPSHTPSQSGGTVRSGWGSSSTSGKFEKTVKAPYIDLRENDYQAQLLKILDEEPVINYDTHYSASQRSTITCQRERDPQTHKIVVDCPACLRGLKISSRFMMNVVDMRDRETVKTWTFGPEVRDQLKGHTEHKVNKSYIPLTREDRYFSAQRVNGSKRISYTVSLVKASDLEEDWLVEPLSTQELEGLTTRYGRETLWVYSASKIQQFADNITDSDLGLNG